MEWYSASSGPQKTGSFDQGGGVHLQSLGQLGDDRDRWIAGASLDIADVGPMNSGAVGIVFLAPAFLEPEPSDVGAKALANIHAVAKTPLSTSDLQTMSDIST